MAIGEKNMRATCYPLYKEEWMPIQIPTDSTGKPMVTYSN